MTRSPLAAIATVIAAALAACAGPADPGLPPFPSSTPVAPPAGTWAAVPTGQPDVTLVVIAYTDPPRITGTQKPACVARANGMLPDPACTPGSIGASADPHDDPAKPADQAEVCNAGFAFRHRPSGTAQAKRAAMVAYQDRKSVV